MFGVCIYLYKKCIYTNCTPLKYRELLTRVMDGSLAGPVLGKTIEITKGDRLSVWNPSVVGKRGSLLWHTNMLYNTGFNTDNLSPTNTACTQ